MPVTFKGDSDNTCMVFGCNEPRHKARYCFFHYCYHYGPDIHSFEDAVAFLAWGIKEMDL
jgi:hypothetical protein